MTPSQALPTRGRGLAAPAATGAAGSSLPLVGTVVSEANREGFLAHSNIDPKTGQRAKKLRTEMTKAEAAMWNMLRDLRTTTGGRA